MLNIGLIIYLSFFLYIFDDANSFIIKNGIKRNVLTQFDRNKYNPF